MSFWWPPSVMLPPDVAAPAANPWDTGAIAAQALDVMRLDPTDHDAERIANKAVEACELIDQELDMAVAYATTADIPASLVGCAVDTTVTLFRLKDAPFGVVDSWSADGGVVRIPSDVLKGVRSRLSKFRDRFSVA